MSPPILVIFISWKKKRAGIISIQLLDLLPLFQSNALILHSWKYQKSLDILVFSGKLKLEHWPEMV